jgi:hypothetical protein
MFSAVPKELDNEYNQQVLSHIKNLSAHDGVAELLTNSVKALGDVQTYCPSWEKFKYVVVSTNGIIFGVALGQDVVAYKIPNNLNEIAQAMGCKPFTDLGNDWIWVNPLKGDAPKVDFKYWARKAYANIRGKT